MNADSIDPAKLARTPQELRALLSSDADWIVRDPAGLRDLREAGHGALRKLSDADFEAFAGSLKFENGGLAGGNYKPLMSLTLSEIHDVLHRFGGHILEPLQLDVSCIEGNCQGDPFGLCSSLSCHHEDPGSRPTA